MPIIQRPDLVAKVRKAYELTGPDAINTISPELVPVVLVDDLSGADPASGVLYAAGYVIGLGSAGEYTSGLIWNPAGSGVDIYLEQALVTSQNHSGGFLIKHYTTAPSWVTTGTVFNRRLGSAGQPAAEVGSRTDAVAPGTTFGIFRSITTWTEKFQFAVRIPEGQGIGFMPDTVNMDIRPTFFWRETLPRV